MAGLVGVVVVSGQFSSVSVRVAVLVGEVTSFVSVGVMSGLVE